MNTAPKKLNNYREDIQFSTSLAADLDRFYLAWFPGAVKVEHVEDLAMQKKGIDKLVYLEDGRVIKLEEKLRRKNWSDVLLETQSRNGKPGWLQTCRADYLAYVFEPSGTVYLLPVLLLQMAWRIFGPQWVKEFGIKRAVNATLGGYVSVNIPVPRKRLVVDIIRSMTGNFKKIAGGI